MKKINLLIVGILIAISVNAQITEEYTYEKSSIDGAGFYTYVSLENNDGKYIFDKYEYTFTSTFEDLIDTCIFSIYNIDYTLYKHINLVEILQSSGSIGTNFGINRINPVWYFSKNLFNSDSNIEFSFQYELLDTINNKTVNGVAIVDENGSVLFNESKRNVNYNIDGEIPQYIINTPNGTKMILAYEVFDPNLGYDIYGGVKIYSLPGTFSGKAELKKSSFNISASPNPAQSFTNINYELPEGVREGTLTIFNMNGNKVKEYKIGSHFNNIKVSTSELPTGSYLYQVTTDKGLSQGRKLIVVQ